MTTSWAGLTIPVRMAQIMAAVVAVEARITPNMKTAAAMAATPLTAKTAAGAAASAKIAAVTGIMSAAGTAIIKRSALRPTGAEVAGLTLRRFCPTRFGEPAVFTKLA